MGKKKQRAGTPMNPLTGYLPAMEESIDAYAYYERKIIKMATSCFAWDGLPETVDMTFMERGLLVKGAMLYFKEDVLGYLCLPSTPAGDLDIYNIPKQRTAYATGANNFYRDETNSVIIYNDNLRASSIPDIRYFAERLYNAKRIQDVNLNAIKTPVLITCEENELLTMKNIYEKYAGDIPVIYAEKGFSPNSINVLKTDAPYYVDMLDIHLQTVWAEVCEYYGVPNVKREKKERLTNDEVGADSGVAKVNGYSRLMQRQLACDQINLIFPDLHVTVDWSEGVKEAWGMDSDEIEAEVLENAKVHSSRPAPH